VVGLEPDAGRSPQGLGDDASLLGAGDLQPRGHAGGGHLLGGLLAVAPVGDEHELLGAHHDDARRTGEAGQVADVGEAGHQEAVHDLLGEQCPQSLDAPGDIHRRQSGEALGEDRGHERSAPSSVATASTARR
jgi:hypothetical protein